MDTIETLQASIVQAETTIADLTALLGPALLDDPVTAEQIEAQIADAETRRDEARRRLTQAEAEREKRAKIIHAAGELEASEKLAQAGAVIAAQPVAITLRYLQTLTEIASEQNSTIVFPLPIEMMHLLKQVMGEEKKA